MKHIKIYTDGGCDKNPGGVGAWAVRLLHGEQVIERSGASDKTTNNRMELTAAIQALELVSEHCRETPAETVDIFTDSQYLAMGMNEWIANWQRHGWKLKDGSPVKNTDLWKELLRLQNAANLQVEWMWVAGHAGDANNMRVDRLVQEAIREKQGLGKSPADTSKAAASTSPPEVKLVKQGKAPVSVRLSHQGAADQFQVAWEHLQGLIEDLLRIQREGEEGRGS